MQQHPGALKPYVPLKGYKHLLGQSTAFRFWKHPHFYKPADYVYTSVEMFKNKDSMLRSSEGSFDDRYISPYKGNPKELIVQAVDNIYDHSDSKGTWKRTFIRDISPWHLRLANWPESHILYADRTRGKLTGKQTLLKVARYIPTAIALITVVCISNLKCDCLAELTFFVDSISWKRRGRNQERWSL